MKNTIFTGAGIAIITPFNADGSINYDELGRIIDDQISNGTDAIIICGTTGESATMTDDEHREQEGNDERNGGCYSVIIVIYEGVGNDDAHRCCNACEAYARRDEYFDGKEQYGNGCDDADEQEGFHVVK